MMKSIRIHCIQHVDFEGPGYIANWADSHQYPLKYTRMFSNELMPSADDFDLLVIMGGPMSIHDSTDFPWLGNEKSAIREYIAQGKKILGICLGAQLIADALGAKVYPNDVKEIGWFDVQFTKQFCKSFKLIDENVTLFHWHGETFSLPEGANLLASTPECKNQAFIFNNQLLALQFHPEITPESLISMIENGKNELVTDSKIQNEEVILNQTQFFKGSNVLMNKLLNEFTKYL